MIKNKSGKGTFTPKFPEKYKGKYPIIIRSEWERLFAQYLDRNNSVIEWSSESIVIPYQDPINGRKRRYYPDFFFKTDKDKFLIEIKPHKEIIPPKKSKKKSKKTMIYETKTYRINYAKFNAASDFCKKMGYKFKIITEKELFT